MEREMSIMLIFFIINNITNINIHMLKSQPKTDSIKRIRFSEGDSSKMKRTIQSALGKSKI